MCEFHVTLKNINMKKENRIIVDFRVKKVIKDELKLGSYPTIRLALAGKADTPQLIRIRQAALKLGGMELPEKQNNESTTM